METQTDLEQMQNTCGVCGLLAGETQIAFTDDSQRVLKFCSEKCYKQYLADPTLYVEFEDDETLE